MHTRHSTLSSLRTETKAAKSHPADHLSVFREFLMQLDQLQRRPPPIKPPRAKAQARRSKARRGRG